MSLLFTPYNLPSPRGGLTLANRIVVAPMCQYAANNGEATDWHLMHWGNLLNSGAGLFTIEATAVVPEGRITPACLGLWDDRTAAALADTLQRARKLATSNVAPQPAQCSAASQARSSEITLVTVMQDKAQPSAPRLVQLAAHTLVASETAAAVRTKAA